MYEELLKREGEMETDWVYLPVFWTNLQNHPGFQKQKYDILFQHAIQAFTAVHGAVQFFTIVQHDDGPQLTLPAGTVVFGACTGTVPLPLIYEDTNNTLLGWRRVKKDLLASFVGQATHPVREEMVRALRRADVVCHMKGGWTPNVSADAAANFVEETLRARFCLAPRGYGRGSFRMYEAMLLDTVPVYVWDDKEWLPYQEVLDYKAFSVSVNRRELSGLGERLAAVSDAEYEAMREELRRVRRWFTLEGMAEYIIGFVKRTPPHSDACRPFWP